MRLIFFVICIRLTINVPPIVRVYASLNPDPFFLYLSVTCVS